MFLWFRTFNYELLKFHFLFSFASTGIAVENLPKKFKGYEYTEVWFDDADECWTSGDVSNFTWYTPASNFPAGFDHFKWHGDWSVGKLAIWFKKGAKTCNWRAMTVAGIEAFLFSFWWCQWSVNHSWSQISCVSLWLYESVNEILKYNHVCCLFYNNFQNKIWEFCSVSNLHTLESGLVKVEDGLQRNSLRTCNFIIRIYMFSVGS